MKAARQFVHLLLVLLGSGLVGFAAETPTSPPAAAAKEIDYPLAPTDREEFRQRVDRIQRGMTVKEALRTIQPLRGFPTPVWDIPGNNSFTQDLGEGWALRLDFADRAAGGLLTAATLRPPVQAQHQTSAFELILVDDRITFDPNGALDLQLLIRNLGEKELVGRDVIRGLSLSWDGKEYPYRPRGFSVGRGDQKIEPRSAQSIPFSVAEFGAPHAAATAGRHSVSLKGAATESNTITLYSGNPKEGARRADVDTSAAKSPDQASLAPEIILDPKETTFENAAAVASPLLVRNVGDAKLQAAPEWYWGLKLVWDGKDFERDPQHKTAWNGPAEILPRSAWRSGISLSEYQVPRELLTDGQHTMAIRDSRAKSNVVTITIGKAK